MSAATINDAIYASHNPRTRMRTKPPSDSTEPTSGLPQIITLRTNSCHISQNMRTHFRVTTEVVVLSTSRLHNVSLIRALLLPARTMRKSRTL